MSIKKQKKKNILTYLIEDDILTLTLIDTGTHADLFDE